jgi:hypothetical protein
MMTSFVKKTLKKAHATLVDRLLEKANLLEAQVHNVRLMQANRASSIHYSDSPTLAAYNTPPYSSDAGSVRTSSPLQSPRIPYTNPIPGRQGVLGTTSPNYLGIDPAYQDAAQYFREQKGTTRDDPRLSYLQSPRPSSINQQLQNSRQSLSPLPAQGLAVELPADDTFPLYPQAQPPYQRDLSRSDYGSQRSQYSQYSQQNLGSNTPPIQELQADVPADDGVKRYQLQDLQPAPLNPSRSPPPNDGKQFQMDPNVKEMAA